MHDSSKEFHLNHVFSTARLKITAFSNWPYHSPFDINIDMVARRGEEGQVSSDAPCRREKEGRKKG